MTVAPRGRRRVSRTTLRQRRARVAVATAAVIAVVIAVAAGVSAIGGGSLPHPPSARPARGPGNVDPFAYVASRESDYVARATAGNTHVLFVKSPGGAMATAARVAAYRPMIDRATSGTGIDPNLLEALVFVESAGQPQAMASTDPAAAVGLTQILAQTGQQLLGMHIDLRQSRKLSGEIDGVAAGTRTGRLAPLLARRAAIDDRFNPAKELVATVRYLKLAESRFGRQDLAIESYHMGIGNLSQVLTDYDRGRPVPYARLYFDTSPDHHSTAYRLLASFGDDSSLYYWRLLGAAQIMRLYRGDRRALARLASLQTADDDGAQVLHPPDRTKAFADPAALASAYQRRALVPLPSNAGALGLAIRKVKPANGTTPSLYRGLRPVALRLLIELAARVRMLSGDRAPLRIYSTVSDSRDQQRAGDPFGAATTGWSFQVSRRYVNLAQAAAFQAVLDRLQSLNLIAWAREPSVIDITVASDGTATAGHGL